jgi:DksA/TraR C4-type zinc finger protein
MLDADPYDNRSDESLLELPEAQPRLTPAARVRIEKYLRQQRATLLASIARLETGSSGASASPASAPQTLAILRGELAQSTRALQRLASGAYGMCEVCGAPIAPGRLQIVPSAALCDACASRPAARPIH